MAESRVEYLCKIASNLTSNNDSVLRMLRSYYLMRCNDVAKGYGLPEKCFSVKVRCPRCYSKWSKTTEVKVQPLKLTKKQQQEIRSQKTIPKKNYFEENKSLLRRNQMLQVCSFCKQSTTTQLIKPEKEYIKSKTPKEKTNNIKCDNKKKQEIKKTPKKSIMKSNSSNNKINSKGSAVANVYSNAFDVFSLKNDKNTLSNVIKEHTVTIKNSKKKKDKYAGLCQKAVLASAKMKQEKLIQEQKKAPQNKLNLFLRQSSS